MILKFDTNGVQFVINPNDEFGLTRAMWFKEKQGASVAVVNVGGPETEPTLYVKPWPLELMQQLE